MRAKLLTILIGLCLLMNAHALTTPYLLVGQVYESDGTTLAVGASVTATNLRTSELLYDTVNSYGWFANIDAGNFPSGYINGDTIQITASKGTDSGSTLIQIDTSVGGLTVPPIVLGGGGTTTTTTTTTTIPTTTTTILSSGLSVAPSSLTISQDAGTTASYYLTITNNGAGTVVNVFLSGIPSDWTTITPLNPYISTGQSRTVQIQMEIPEDEDGTHTGTILCNGVSIPLTLHIDKNFYEIIDEDWLEEGREVSFNGYDFTVVSLRSSYIKVDLFEDGDDIVDNKKCYKGQETALGSHFKIFVHKIDSDEGKAKITLFADEEFDEVESNIYKYTLFENVQFNAGTWLSFEYGQFYLHINTLADTGARIDYYAQTNQPEIHSCFINSDCKIGDVLITIKSIARGTTIGTGTAVITLKSKKQYMVYRGSSPLQGQGQGQFDQFQDPWQSQSPWQTQPQGSQGNLYISIAGGKIAPTNKVIFFIKDYNNMPVKTGTLTIDLLEPVSVDIHEGLATVRFPPMVECPILLTATATGYQTSPQVFTSCSEEGSEGTWWSTYASSKANCSDGIKNCHDGACEVGIDCGGSCSPCKLTLSLSPTTPSMGTTVTVVVTSANKGMENVDVTIQKPDGTTETYTSDADGKAEFTIDKSGTYTVSAEKEDYAKAEKKVSTKAKTMSISISPTNPDVGDNVYVSILGEGGGAINPTTLTVNSLPIPTKTFQVRAEGEYTIVAENPSYDKAEHTFKVYGLPYLVSQPPEFKLNEMNRFQLDRPVAWTILKDGIVVDSGTQSSFDYTPTDAGTYSIVASGTELATYTAGGGYSIATFFIFFVACALIIVVILAKKGKVKVKEGGGLKDKKKADEVQGILDKIQKGKDVEVSAFS